MVKIGLTLASALNVPSSSWTKVTNLFGIEHIEYTAISIMDLEETAQAFKGKQIAFHAPYRTDFPYDLSSEDPYTSEINEFISKVNRSKKLFQVPIVGIVVHPPLSSKYDYRLFCERLNNLQSLPLLENLFPGNGPYSENWDVFVQFYESLQGHTEKRIGFCFDIPHSFIANGSKFLDLPSILLEELQSPRGYIHISGSQRDFDSHMPLGDSEIPYDHVFNFLEEIGFQGTINLEISPFGCPNLTYYFNGLLDSYHYLLNLESRMKRYYRKILDAFYRPRVLKRLKETEGAFQEYKNQNLIQS